MLQPCEVAVKSLVPAIRSAIAQELIEKHGLRQKDAAGLLGITQSAVSKYTTLNRGALVQIRNQKQVKHLIVEIVNRLANGGISRYELVSRLCEVCEEIRRQREMCELCKRLDPSIELERCLVC